jgi:hypothetical protein
VSVVSVVFSGSQLPLYLALRALDNGKVIPSYHIVEFFPSIAMDLVFEKKFSRN